MSCWCLVRLLCFVSSFFSKDYFGISWSSATLFINHPGKSLLSDWNDIRYSPPQCLGIETHCLQSISHIAHSKGNTIWLILILHYIASYLYLQHILRTKSVSGQEIEIRFSNQQWNFYCKEWLSFKGEGNFGCRLPLKFGHFPSIFSRSSRPSLIFFHIVLVCSFFK